MRIRHRIEAARGASVKKIDAGVGQDLISSALPLGPRTSPLPHLQLIYFLLGAAYFAALEAAFFMAANMSLVVINSWT
jgi:hypothetical protein